MRHAVVLREITIRLFSPAKRLLVFIVIESNLSSMDSYNGLFRIPNNRCRYLVCYLLEKSAYIFYTLFVVCLYFLYFCSM